MNSQEIRQKFLAFFESKNHKIIPSASLVPANDPTVLFTTAGMHPLVPYLMGETHPAGTRLANYQKCLRTDDIDEVGDATHLTFFEMLGNWSLGDYWKQDSISWSYEFLTDPKWLGIDKSRLAVSVFTGDNDAPRDEESAQIWKSLGMPENRIAYLGKKDNWWGPPGASGPCGPDTEIFYWVGEEPAPEKFDPENKKWVEIWNNVFMQYEKTVAGEFIALKQKNVDTGMGLERITTVLAGKENVYETDLFQPILEEISKVAPGLELRSQRIVADHIRASVFLLADGVLPSNKERGYILRRLIRSAVANICKVDLNVDSKAVGVIANVVRENYKSFYPELDNDKLYDDLSDEVKKFRATLEKGLKMLEGKTTITGKEAFDLFQSYGFPKELTKQYVSFDENEFAEELKKHQELSRTASSGMFKGGLASHSEKVVKLHTATHLLNAALRKVLGPEVWQKGSNITEERTRFDFTHNAKMTDEQKKEVEKLVNEWIAADYPVKRETMSQDKARELGAIGVFGEKYADEVSIYSIVDPKSSEVISREFCGGPHVEHTGVIGKFNIQKEEAVSAGVRRIKATIS